MLYTFFSVAHTFAQHSASKVRLSKIVPTILIYFMKLALACSMYKFTDGSFQHFQESMKGKKDVVLKYCLPAGCMAVYDLLSFWSLGRLSPAKYQVLLHLRTVMIAFFWQFVMKSRLTAIQWTALTLCIWAAMLTERAAIAELFTGNDARTTLWPYATLALQYALAIFGNLANEKFLKEVNLPVNAQNILMYSLGSTILVAGLGIASLVNNEPIVVIEDLPLIMEPSVFWSILTLSFLGISVGFVLKTSGNIFKELAGMAVTFITSTIDFLWLGNPFSIVDVQAILTIAFGLGFFSLLHIVKGSVVLGSVAHEKGDTCVYADTMVIQKSFKGMVLLAVVCSAALPVFEGAFVMDLM